MAMIVYTVRPGDSLWSIAKRFNTTVDDLVRMNNISDPDAILPGQRLRIDTPNFPRPSWYIVRPGDTLASIAQNFDTTVENLVRLNSIRNPDVIYAGRILRLRP